jgi:hypothetical protein
MLSTLPAKRFNPQRGKATNYECRIFNFIDCYQIGFKMTVELQRFVSWKPPDPPTPTAINQIKKIAYTDLEYPIKTFIAEKLQLYTPFCRTPESHSLYTALLRQFIETKVTSVTDVINKKFYIVIKK